MAAKKVLANRRKQKAAQEIQQKFSFKEEAFLRYKKAYAELKSIKSLQQDQEILAQLEEETTMDRWGEETLGVDGFSLKFTGVIALFVVLNAITIGVETDHAESS